jgi:GT2 family glycosyltransferase
LTAAGPLAVVIIVNWNGRQTLCQVLTAIFDHLQADVGVIVVDNGSTDGSIEWLASHHPRVQAIQLPRNLGFAAANNLGIAATTARYVITLNNDTEIEHGWVESLIEAAESDPTIGSCASRIVLAARPDRLDSAGISVD